MLIDYTYFAKGTRQIMNATLGPTPSPNSVEVCGTIEAYISEYQETYLRGMLGDETGNKINAYLICIDEDEKPEHIQSFDSVCERLKDSFADYVFFHILRDINTQTTITGLVRLKCANAYVSPIRKQVDIWNAMVDKHRMFQKWSKSDCIKKELLEKINHFNL